MSDPLLPGSPHGSLHFRPLLAEQELLGPVQLVGADEVTAVGLCATAYSDDPVDFYHSKDQPMAAPILNPLTLHPLWHYIAFPTGQSRGLSFEIPYSPQTPRRSYLRTIRVREPHAFCVKFTLAGAVQ